MAFGLLIIYVFVLLVRPQEWYGEVRGFSLVELSAILTLLATFVSQRPGQPLTQLLSRDKYARLMWGLLGAVVLSQLIRFRLHGALDAFTDFGKTCVLFFLTMTLSDSPTRVRKMMWVIVICATLLSIHGIMQVQTGVGFGGIRPFGSFYTEDFRIQGTGMFNDPNDFALLFIVATGFILALLQLRGGFIGKMLLVSVMPGILYTVYFTRSRGGLVGFCVMLGIFAWSIGRNILLRIILSGALLAAVVALGPARARATVYEGSAGGRIIQWGYGNQFLKQNPLFGIGYNRWLEFSDQVAHSSFVTCYGELGLVGYAFWFGLCWLTLKGLLKVSRARDTYSPSVIRTSLGMASALAGFLGAAFFLTRTYNPLLFLMLGLGVGLIRYVQLLPETPPGFLDITKRDVQKMLVIAIASIPTIWILVRLYWAVGGSRE